MSFSIFLIYIVIVMLAVYGSIKFFYQMRAEWRRYCVLRDSKTAECRKRRDFLAGLPRTVLQMDERHNDLLKRLERIDNLNGSRATRLSRIDENMDSIQKELRTIRRALKGYI